MAWTRPLLKVAVGSLLALGLATAGESDLPWAFNAPPGDGYAIHLLEATPAPGTPLNVGEAVKFSVKLSYALTKFQHGHIILLFQDEKDKNAKPDGPQVSVAVDAPGGEVTLEDTVTVPKRAKELRLFIPLAPEGVSETTGEVTLRFPIAK